MTQENTVLMQDRQQAPVELKIDWCSHEAARYACLNWHYSKSVPAGKLVKIGAWENGQFIGCVIFSRGVTKDIASPYNMTQTEVCELTRVALTKHISPVTQILAKAIKMLKRHNPGLKLIVSYADCDQEHKGVIYQACNWIYEGHIQVRGAIMILGRKRHARSIHSKYGTGDIQWLKDNVDPETAIVPTAGRHKYLYPLDRQTAKEIQPLSKPYPSKSKGG